MAIPPVIRQTMKSRKVWAQPVKTEETANKMAERIRSFLRPKRSLIAPERIEPMRQPMRAQLLAQPTSSSEVS